MSINHAARGFAAVWILIGILGAPGCAPPSTVQSTVSEGFRPDDTRPMALLPLQTGSFEKDGAMLKNVGVEANAPAVLTQMLYQKLRGRRDIDLVPMDEVRAALAKAGDDLRSGPINRLAGWIGNEVRAQSVLGLDMVLIQTSTLNVLWKSAYFEKQQALTDDVRTFPLYISRGGKWVRAMDLAQYGIDQMLDTLPISGSGRK
jgi:hypothetical protein